MLARSEPQSHIKCGMKPKIKIMKKQILLLGAAAVLFSIQFAGCKKEVNEPLCNQVSSQNQQRTGLTVDFGYKLYTLSNNDGSTDYRCLKPKVDCSKVKSVETSLRVAQQDALDIAISNNEVADFFMTESNWEELFPNLTHQPDWLELLTEGTARLAKKKDGIDQGLLYIAYDPSVDPEEITEGDVFFAIGITNSEE
jgi:hypothetical protein